MSINGSTRRSYATKLHLACAPYVGPSWTTGAPFRETAAAVEAAQAKGILAVEMEAAALYAFARRRNVAVLCLAHVTNRMGISELDFEKGEADSASDALALLNALAKALHPVDS